MALQLTLQEIFKHWIKSKYLNIFKEVLYPNCTVYDSHCFFTKKEKFVKKKNFGKKISFTGRVSLNVIII